MRYCYLLTFIDGYKTVIVASCDFLSSDSCQLSSLDLHKAELVSIQRLNSDDVIVM